MGYIVRGLTVGYIKRPTLRLHASWLAALCVCVTAVVHGSAPASAETIASALSKAYVGNPQLKAEQARQRATDEQVPQAKSGWRPTVTTNSDIRKTYQGSRSSDGTTVAYRKSDFLDGGFQINLSQPVFDGFRTENALREADATVRAGNQNLLAVEQQVLLDGAIAFMDVIRDRQIANYRRASLDNFKEQVRAATARFDVGEVTRTDVAQANARSAEARGRYAVAVGNLETSVANYIRVIGVKPGRLIFPPLSPRVPKTLRQAIAISGETNPQILAAAYVEQAAEANIGVQKSDLLPKVNFEASYLIDNNSSNLVGRTRAGVIAGTLSVPIYQSGRVYSQIREAKQIASQRRLEVLDVHRQVRERVVSAWHILKAATVTIAAAKEAVAANKIALDGVTQEAQVGTRTTLDVLDAENELVETQVALANSLRDRIVAGYQLVAAIGHMTAGDLRLSVNVYDPRRNLEEVRDKAFGARINTSE
ncbi:MAG: TolC family outer membrane protein [Anderseniella sp.]